MDRHYNNLNRKIDALKQRQKKSNTGHNNNQAHDFFPRTVNLTNIKFTQEEMSMLNNGLQHSTTQPLEKYWNNLIIETEQAIKLLDQKMQQPFRIIASKKLKQMLTNDRQRSTMEKRQTYTIKTINEKLVKGNAILVKADKGKTCVIIYSDDYTEKTQTFLTDNNFQNLNNNPTDKFQKQLIKTLLQCDRIIPKKQIRYFIQKKPQSPTLNAQIKIHKPGNPIRPVINNMKAPSYKIAKHLVNKLNAYLNLEYQYNVQNSTTLAKDLINLTIHEDHRITTYDIKDLYVNIPTDDTPTITKALLKKHNDPQTTTQLLTLLETILQQNYLTFQDRIYKPEKGVSMGSPISNTIAEIFLQHFESILMKQLIETKHIVYYTRYVDDILLIYNTQHISPERTYDFINQIHPNLHFNPTYEQNNNISFLDLLITRHPTKLEIDIYRKPTTTDTTINFHSNHPNEHKLAAYRYYINRMLLLPLTEKRRQAEWNTIKSIAKNNNYPIHHITRLKTQLQNKTRTTNTTDTNKKWAIFTYHNPNIRKITNLFKNTNINIAFRSTNTLR
jgi:hypothetical protein